MTKDATDQAAAMAVLTARLAGADLVGFGRDAHRQATPKVGQSKNPPPPPPEGPGGVGENPDV